MTSKSGEQIALDLIDMVNRMGSAEEEQKFVDTILNSHRTLQQSTAGLFLKMFAGWAEVRKVGHYDLRNEATVNIATKITEAVEDTTLPFI